MKVVISLVFLFLFSCTKTVEYDVELDGMFYVLANDLEIDCEDLKKIISYREELKLPNQKYQDYKDETTSYLIYLEKLDSLNQISEYGIFFDGDVATFESELFIKNTRNYLGTLHKVAIEPAIELRVNRLLGIKDVLISENVYGSYINWYFKGASKNTFRYLIINRKRNVLLIQEEILNQKLFEESN